jgi:hypothetical protein
LQILQCYNDIICSYKSSLAYMLNDFFSSICYTVVYILALTTGISVYLHVYSTKGVWRVGSVSRGC